MALNGDDGVPTDNDGSDRSFGLGGRDFQSSPGKKATSPLEKPSLMSSWMDRMNKKVKELSEEAKEAMTSKNLRKMKQQITELVKPQNKTVDVELTKMVQTVETSKHDLKVMTELLKTVATSMKRAAEDQLALSACFEQFAATAADAAPQLGFHHRIMDLFGKNGVGLIEALSFLRTKTEEFISTEIDAAQKQVGEYESCRIEYDARRVQFESLKDTQSPKLPGAEAAFLEAYNTLSEVRSDTWTILCTCERLKVEFFKKELAGLMNAVSMYNSGNQSGFEEAMEKMKLGE